MRIADIVNRLHTTLPKYTDLFGDSVSISSINASGGVATITTSSAHNLITNQTATLSNVAVRTPIGSVEKDGLIYKFTTSSDHDLTYGWSEHKNISLGGFSDSDWNDTFLLKSSNTRSEFTIQSTNSIPLLNGNEYLLEYNRVDGVDGKYGVNVINSNTFTIGGDFADGEYAPLNGVVYAKPRISATIDIDRTIEEYTLHGENEFWMAIEPVDVNISKDRSSYSDANNSIANGNDMRTRMIDGFTAYIIAPTSNELEGELSIDICRHDLLLPMMKSLYGYQFDTGTNNGMDFKTTLNSHGVRAYDKAYMVYAYEFEVVVDLTSDDAVEADRTRAFRDIDLNVKTQNDNADVMDVNVNLDIGGETDDVIIELPPEQFGVGDWSVVDSQTGGSVGVNILSLPNDNGSEITDIEYSLNNGAWVSSGGIVTFNITGLINDTEYDIELRAVNSVGGGSDSDVKSVTPTLVVSPFSPTDISNIDRWYDVSDDSTVTHVSNSVSQLDDKSGNSYHISQPTASRQPTYDNSNNNIHFDGNDWLEGSNPSLWDAGSATCFCITSDRVNVNADTLFAESGASDFYSFQRLTGVDGNTSAQFYINGTTILNDLQLNYTSPVPTAIHQQVYTDSGSLVSYYENGVLGDIPRSYARDPLYAGSFDRFALGGAIRNGGDYRTINAKVYEFISYTRVLSDVEINQVGNYLANKWGLSWTDI